ncbi:MAG: RNA 3'-terminal phosphate cyclase [Enhygromyxa sp.]
MSKALIVIDGSRGEGGGQILRTSLALSAITGEPFRVTNIRARRRKPGLMRQHLTAVEAAARVACAEVQGAELRSSELEFRPGIVQHGDYSFSIGTAGSATLVLQTVLWPLVVTPGRSRLVLEGGTHNPMAPPFEFLDRAFLPLLRRLELVVEAKLEQAGFYPAGGGRVVVEIEGGRIPTSLCLDERGELVAREALAMVANLPRSIAVRELGVVKRELGWSREECRVLELQGRGPGNALCLMVQTEALTEVVTGIGEKGVLAEDVAAAAVAELRRWLDSGAPVDEHLGDQLLIPMALTAAHAREGDEAPRYVGPTPSLHTTTNAEIIGRFLPVEFEFEALDERRTRVWARRRGE